MKALVTHCGTNSVQDAIYAAKPILTYPGFADQPLTSNLLISSVYSRQGIEYTLCRSKTDAADLKLEVKLGSSSLTIIARQGIEYRLCRSKTEAADLKLEVK